MFKIIFIASFVIQKIYETVKVKLNDIATKWPVPENVKDVYNEDEYKNWLNYRNENKKLSLFESLADAVITILLLVFDVYAFIFKNMPGNEIVQYILMLLIFEALFTVIGIPFNYYSTFVIEEKYGLNRTTKKTFVADIIKNFIVGIAFTFALFFAVMLTYKYLGNTGLIIAAVIIAVFMIGISACSMLILKINNKFTPLEDGELKDKLMALCTKYGVEVKGISVMDGSRRSTRANAFCTGLGKKKSIALYDTLIERYTPDQITAVFAHEFGHAKYLHNPKMTIFNVGNILLIVAVIGVMLNIPSLYTDFGFEGINYYFTFSTFNILGWPLMELFSLAGNVYSRKCEYQADAFAAGEGYGDELISSLKTLNKDSLSNLNPHPFIVTMEYSHPTLSQRIDAIEKAEEK